MARSRDGHHAIVVTRTTHSCFGIARTIYAFTSMREDAPGSLEALQQRADALLRDGAGATRVIAVLDAILKRAPRGSDAERNARLRAAEVLLERDPWRAARHLHALMGLGADDETTLGLAGLCHSILGNYRYAVRCYRRAIARSPKNPWFQHNLGHVLDIALERPDLALPALERAHDLAPLEDEIVASLAHCMAALGRISEASALAEDACRAAPEHEGHRRLAAWIAGGASGAFLARPTATQLATGKPIDLNATPELARAVAEFRAAEDNAKSSPPTPNAHASIDTSMETIAELVAQIVDDGFRTTSTNPQARDRARDLWRDFVTAEEGLRGRAEIWAAAVEHLASGGTEKVTEVAKRRGVSPGAVRQRITRIRETLGLGA